MLEKEYFTLPRQKFTDNTNDHFRGDYFNGIIHVVKGSRQITKDSQLELGIIRDLLRHTMSLSTSHTGEDILKIIGRSPFLNSNDSNEAIAQLGNIKLKKPEFYSITSLINGGRVWTAYIGWLESSRKHEVLVRLNDCPLELPRAGELIKKTLNFS